MSNIVSEDINFGDILICLFMRQLWQQSLAAETGIEINIASWMCILARCFLPLHYLPHPFFSSLLFPPSCHISEKSGSTGVKLMWWKTTGISLWAICFALMATLSRSPQRGSRLSVAIGGVLQISQQLSEVTSQVLRWPHSLPTSPLLELRLHAQLQPKLCFSGLPLVCLKIVWSIFFGTSLIFLSQLNLCKPDVVP